MELKVGMKFRKRSRMITGKIDVLLIRKIEKKFIEDNPKVYYSFTHLSYPNTTMHTIYMDVFLKSVENKTLVLCSA